MSEKNLLPVQIRSGLQEVGNTLNAMLVEDSENVLGEPWITTLKNVRDEINTTLASFPLTEQIPAANEAHYSLMSLHRTMLGVQNMVNFIRGSMKAMGDKVTQTRNSAVAEFTAKIEKGELIAKDAVEGLVAKAKTDGESAGFLRGKLLGDRRQALTLCSIPAEVVAKAPESILLAEEKDFDGKKIEIKARWGKLTGIGFTHATASVLDMPFAEDFDNRYAPLELLSKTKGATHNSAPARPNPMIAAPTTGTETQTPPKRMVIAL